MGLVILHVKVHWIVCFAKIIFYTNTICIIKTVSTGHDELEWPAPELRMWQGTSYNFAPRQHDNS